MKTVKIAKLALFGTISADLEKPNRRGRKYSDFLMYYYSDLI